MLNPVDLKDALAPVVTIEDLSRVLHRHRASIYRDIELGRLPRPSRIGRSVRWSRSDLIAALCGEAA